MSSQLSQRDQAVIWHPYTQHSNMLPPVAIARGQGALLFDDEGNNYIDAISSWWVNIHGHAHPYIAEKVYEQARTLEHVIFTGFTHQPAVLLAERLLALLPGDFSKIFYSENGSTAVEVAIKMAIQYWKNLSTGQYRRPGARTKILAFKNAYHGDTFGAMSVSEKSLFTLPFRDFLFEVQLIDVPNTDNLDALISLVRQQAEDIACFIYEPLLQAAGGMLMHDARALDLLLAEIKSHQIICIADEVMTGFYRTGELFASGQMQTKPDLLCMSKGLTGGTMALGATAATAAIFNAFVSPDRNKTFFHGHSFTANPIACAAALASLDLITTDGCKKEVARIISRQHDFKQSLYDLQKRAIVKNVRQLGTIVAFEINQGQDGYLNQAGATLTAQAMENGIYLRPLGNTVYVMPPYCISDKELAHVHHFLLAVYLRQ